MAARNGIVKKKLGPSHVQRSALALGQQVYDFNCYFCHGYRGDARTLAAQTLNPPPLNFWRAADLTPERIERAVRFGRPGTAMQSFAARLSVEEIRAVAIYIASGLAGGAAYHTAANGWPDHEKRNGPAYPFVLGEIPLDAAETDLSPDEIVGRNLFRSACSNCHEGRRHDARVDIFRRVDEEPEEIPAPEPKVEIIAAVPAGVDAPRRRSGDCSRCHDDFDSSGNPLTRRAAAEAYGPGPHDVTPEFANLTTSESRGRDLYQAACADCHAADGTGANWVGNFLEQSPTDFNGAEFARNYQRQAFKQAVLEGLTDTSMPSFKAVISDAEAEDIARYVERAFLSNASASAKAGD